jgi:hypothetical protein
MGYTRRALFFSRGDYCFNEPVRSYAATEFENKNGTIAVRVLAM